MDGFRIDFNELQATSDTIAREKENFDSLLSNIQTINTELAAVWEGTDSSKYSQKVAEQAEYMKQLSTAVGEISVFLTKVVKAYQDAVDANTL